MAKHLLFLLTPGFSDEEEGLFFCPHSAAMEGFIKYVPAIEEKVDVRRIAFQRPRPDIIELLGEENQGTPVLVLAKGTEIPPEAQVSEKTGRAFILDEIEITKYLSRTFGVMRPH
ncbi:MAG TPA: DUF3088 family protein [Anaerolineales bacterium]|nr:DUF3088 family protein [Anaerolineales bacterium]